MTGLLVVGRLLVLAGQFSSSSPSLQSSVPSHRTLLIACLGEGSKTPITAFCRDGGGGTPFAVIFFPFPFWPAACRDGGEGGTPLCRD